METSLAMCTHKFLHTPHTLSLSVYLGLPPLLLDLLPHVGTDTLKAMLPYGSVPMWGPLGFGGVGGQSIMFWTDSHGP